ncbi:MAG TPA: putative sulfate exporter family transporter, partial [Arenibaculum sp.]|nr:putative sulfate exporter family transporter [Arenibaculum sp.]
LASTFLAEHYGSPAMLFALLMGMAFNFISNEERFATGIGFSARQVLRFGVALLGARITLDHIVALGWGALAGVAAAVALTIGFGVLGAHVLGLRTRFGVLSAGATAICGASAAAAISAVLPRYENQERDTAFTIISVTTFSTIAMILYPVAAGFFDWDDTRIGIFLGGTIHDVAQVVGAGYSVSPEAGDTATIVKLLRVALLVPAVLLIALGSRREAGTAGKRPPLIPGFLVAFLAIVALNSMGLIPELVTGAMTTASSWCIVTAIAALGVKTALGQMLTVGRRAIGLIVAETLFIAAVVIAFLSASPPG